MRRRWRFVRRVRSLGTQERDRGSASSESAQAPCFGPSPNFRMKPRPSTRFRSSTCPRSEIRQALGSPPARPLAELAALTPGADNPRPARGRLGRQHIERVRRQLQSVWRIRVIVPLKSKEGGRPWRMSENDAPRNPHRPLSSWVAERRRVEILVATYVDKVWVEFREAVETSICDFTAHYPNSPRKARYEGATASFTVLVSEAPDPSSDMTCVGVLVAGSNLIDVNAGGCFFRFEVGIGSEGVGLRHEGWVVAPMTAAQMILEPLLFPQSRETGFVGPLGRFGSGR